MSDADPDLFVREAEPGDAEVLMALEQAARQAIADLRGGARRLEECPASAGNWVTVLADVDRGVVVGGIDEVILAWLAVVGPDCHGVAVIESVFVDEAARDLGLGDALVAWALSWAQGRQATSIESWALPGDRSTKNLFERNGLTARLITVSRSLSEPASSADASR